MAKLYKKLFIGCAWGITGAIVAVNAMSCGEADYIASPLPTTKQQCKLSLEQDIVYSGGACTGSIRCEQKNCTVDATLILPELDPIVTKNPIYTFSHLDLGTYEFKCTADGADMVTRLYTCAAP